jgi:predicted type IV restriction endonuclease
MSLTENNPDMIKEKLLSFIEQMQLKKIRYSIDEATTKQTIILPILSILGWDTTNSEEVEPEHSLDNARVDYLLSSNDTEVFIEVKRPSENLYSHEEQLIYYSHKGGAELAVLTNGIKWWFYHPLMKGHWKGRKIGSLDISWGKMDLMDTKVR